MLINVFIRIMVEVCQRNNVTGCYAHNPAPHCAQPLTNILKMWQVWDVATVANLLCAWECVSLRGCLCANRHTDKHVPAPYQPNKARITLLSVMWHAHVLCTHMHTPFPINRNYLGFYPPPPSVFSNILTSLWYSASKYSLRRRQDNRKVLKKPLPSSDVNGRMQFESIWICIWICFRQTTKPDTLILFLLRIVPLGMRRQIHRNIKITENLFLAKATELQSFAKHLELSLLELQYKEKTSLCTKKKSQAL